MRLLLARGFDDFLRRQPDALIHDLHAGIARTYCNLLGAIGMAVQSRLANEEREPATKFAGNAVDIGADVVEPGDVVAHRATNAGRRPVFAESLAQRPSPFAGCDARFCA